MTGERKLTGRKVLIITLGAFGIVLAANMALLFSALGSFPGLVVRNSYVASQSFDAEARAQAALGWTASLSVDGDGDRVALRIADGKGRLVRPADIALRIGRPTHRRADRLVELSPSARGWQSAAGLEPGAWTGWVTATAPDGTAFRVRLPIYVPDRS